VGGDQALSSGGMWQLALSSIKLFCAGKLFADHGAVLRQSLLGAAATAVAAAGLVLAGLPLPAAAGIAGFAGGVLQPFLFKNLRYR
jgi:hypothetical protein